MSNVSTDPCTVELTRNFTRNLSAIEVFLIEHASTEALHVLIRELTGTIVPNLELFPRMGRLLLSHPTRSVQGVQAVTRLSEKLNAIAELGELREYLTSDYLILYVLVDRTVSLLSIRHHQQTSFDMAGHWDAM